MTKTAVTKVKDLIVLLSQCDPEGEVTLSLDEAVAFGDDDIGIASYSFTPVFTCLFSAEDKTIADSISIELSEEDTRRLVKHRTVDSPKLDAKPSSSVVSDAPVAIAVAVSSETYQNLEVVVANCNESNESSGGATTHGALNVSTLLSMMAEDLAMTNTRPGSWEGSNMQQVLDSHGYH